MTAYKPKLIEVALPLAAINDEAAREKSIRFGHPSTLHLWWARRPLAAARAVIWSSLVDDPSADASLSPEEQEAERQRLFRILERLVMWENSNDPDVLSEARAEIDRCFPEGPPPVLDPFGGGGTIPLEAQRLGLEALSGDLNPVAVTIQKAMIEIPPRFAGRAPVHPRLTNGLKTWERAQGLAADIEAYGEWMRSEAKSRLGHLYPDVAGPDGLRATPIAWIWARTVESPDPSWSGHVPLVGSWLVADRAGAPKVWVEPIIDRNAHAITYEIRRGDGPVPTRTIKGGQGVCIATGAAIPSDYIKGESAAGRMGVQLLAVVVPSASGRTFVSATEADVAASQVAPPEDLPAGRMSDHPQYMGTYRYGLDEWWKLFTSRQLVMLTTLADLLAEIRTQILRDAAAAGASGGAESVPLREGGAGPAAYADAVITYLALGISRLTDVSNSLCRWSPTRTQVLNLFGRQAVSMVWDFAENNPFNDAGGDFRTSLKSVTRALDRLPASSNGVANQRAASASVLQHPGVVISTDPPYYDAVPYSDISDFFYVWMRRTLRDVWPDEFATLLTPKSEEMVADSQRFGGKAGAKSHFESAMADFMKAVAASQSTEAPATVYYAYKATESDGSTGWSTFLQAVLDAGLQVNATWPLRTERATRMRSLGANALASSIVLVCRSRNTEAPLASRGEFVGALRAELPDAVRLLQSGNIAPVDIAQSTIGPGIKVFSRYAKVVEADGSAMSVSAALGIINDVLGEVLDGEEAELDADTRFAVTWYAQHGYNPGRSGDADGQARAKNTSLAGIEAAGIGEARGGDFRLFERRELDSNWSPAGDARLAVWEATQHLVASLERSETEAAALLHQLGGYGDRARQLAYLLFQKATEKGWADEAGSYNGLITAWPTLAGTAVRSEQDDDGQGRML